MSKTTERDNFFAYTAAVVVVCLAAIVMFTWSQVRSHTVQPEVSFSSFGPYQIETQELSISAKLAVQTSRSDASWPNSNREMLNTVFKHILESTDPKILKAPHGLQQLQDALTEGCNAELHSSKYVQAVLLTDFVAQSRDS
jgi:flagellar basal body-associated protein FliL